MVECGNFPMQKLTLASGNRGATRPQAHVQHEGKGLMSTLLQPVQGRVHSTGQGLQASQVPFLSICFLLGYLR